MYIRESFSQLSTISETLSVNFKCRCMFTPAANTRGHSNAEMLETKGQREFNYLPLDCIISLAISTLSGGLRGRWVKVRSTAVVSPLNFKKFFLVFKLHFKWSQIIFAVSLRDFMSERQQTVWIEVDMKNRCTFFAISKRILTLHISKICAEFHWWS